MRCPAAISDGSRPNQIHAIPPQDRVTSRTSQPRGLYLRSDTSRTRSRFTHPIQGSVHFGSCPLDEIPREPLGRLVGYDWGFATRIAP